MNKATFFTIILMIFSLTSHAQDGNDIFAQKGEKSINGEASSFNFTISNLGMFSADGTMGGIEGRINFDAVNTDNFVEIKLAVKTIDTGIDKRDEHLKSADFFDAENHPHIIFRGGKLSKMSDGIYVVDGSLTMRGVTLPKKVPVRMSKNGDKYIFKGKVTVDRSKYGIDGGSTVGDEAEVTYTIVTD